MKHRGLLWQAQLTFYALALSGAASGNVIITSGSAQSVFHSLFDYFKTDLSLEGAGFSSHLGPLNYTGPRTPDFMIFGPSLIPFNFTQQLVLGTTPLSSASPLTYNGTAYGTGYAVQLQLDFFGPVVSQQANCTYFPFTSALQQCSVGWSNIPFTMDGWFRILNNQNQMVAADTLSGLGLASASASINQSAADGTVSYAFTTPEPSSLVMVSGGILCLGLLRRKTPRRNGTSRFGQLSRRDWQQRRRVAGVARG